MTIRVVIPARYASTRLPGKPLRDIAGKPMIRHVYERALESEAGDVIIATDDERIAAACRRFDARVCMTSADHASGTDRIAEVAERSDWSDDDILVNVQGDEPMIPPALISQVGRLLVDNEAASMATVGTPIRALDEFLDPNVVKVVMSGQGTALYFSRAPIPWDRDGAPGSLVTQTRFDGALRHIGIYAYRVAALRRLAATPPCPLEETECLEQLRALWLGMIIRVDVAIENPGQGVDTEEDLQRVEALLAGEAG